MPSTLGGIFRFVLVATVTVIVGNYVYNKFFAPMLSRFVGTQKAA